ncbi:MULTISPECIES: hypothetical protein [Meiothermus]|jgi:hypothetical protein|uniref:Uncharacterized protein n=1 Tax=Meiothermus ruber (strain ATCC 35948 / DSM 1279 / VKM B-1258 / 21) TaxID=504728 RepID=A0A806DNJ7_MEIRD|nr:hypothetical protein [Meiothermus ruber]ADD29414.1 hypothetical protein Mrub_2664 [Meiothermus ruber DSM 1279]MCL6530932.1 hypothetical protein [Meiothermus ruber]GIW38724.1 MAG: hypothetical protein KatS3mg075_205 [Meiothermus sp.]
MLGKSKSNRHLKKNLTRILLSLFALVIVAVNGDMVINWNSGLAVAVWAIVLFAISLNAALAVLALLRGARPDKPTAEE